MRIIQKHPVGKMKSPV